MANFVCKNCYKTCKSKGGLTNHRNRCASALTASITAANLARPATKKLELPVTEHLTVAFARQVTGGPVSTEVIKWMEELTTHRLFSKNWIVYKKLTPCQVSKRVVTLAIKWFTGISLSFKIREEYSRLIAIACMWIAGNSLIPDYAAQVGEEELENILADDNVYTYDISTAIKLVSSQITEVETVYEETECVVCKTANASVLLVPCGHKCVCGPCHIRLLDICGNKCPICRMPTV